MSWSAIVPWNLIAADYVHDCVQFAHTPLCEALMNVTKTIQPIMLKPVSVIELASANDPHRNWLWHGFLAPGKVTALISPPKSGKTTLLSHLLVRFGQGGQMAGLAVAPARVLVLSEESAADWDARCRQLTIGPNVQFLCRPFEGARPTDDQWLGLIAGLEALHRQEPFDLVVIDALAALLPGYAETCGPMLLDCLLPLQKLANLGPAVWLLHHPAKSKRADGQTARGSGVLVGLADIVMELSYVRRARSRDRRRRLCAYSRYPETPRHLVMELNADGTDYTVVPPRSETEGESSYLASWPQAHDILATAYRKLSQQEMLEWWPQDEDKPDRTRLSRWLKRAVKKKVICRDGAGHRGDVHRYWLPGREPMLFPGHDAGKEAIDAWKERCSADTQERLLGTIRQS